MSSVLESTVRLAYSTFSFLRRKNMDPVTAAAVSTKKGRDSPCPSPTHVKRLMQELDKITATELRLKESMRGFEYSAEPFTYCDIFEGDMLSVGIFVLHPGSKIPLHDHPKMYGLIKVIHGELLIQSYSQVSPTNADNGDMLIAEEKPPLVATSESPPLLLTPTENNYHQIEHIQGEGEDGHYAAFIDFLLPPYGLNDGPDCNYYQTKELPIQQGETKRLVQLIKSPELAQNNNAAYYFGPRVDHLKRELYGL